MQKFQKRHRVGPDVGYAGPVTYGTTMLLAARKRPDPKRKCPNRTVKVSVWI
ncbi:hypothetical protein G3I40_04185 [Streptomyces sp. SID14478]|uniref:hypothetical protein n=1 Tax=Streptomyces sp. SID14478 TaxID=2706073 RepID=UPI0013D9EE3A|nr:hypothetical protein [Streptomyces sp. SID14478]NEB74433.1 hypothetical protein [Streptomyces sp. SID14478]